MIGTLGKTGGITGHWLEPTCDGGTDPNNPCYTLSGLTSYVNLAQANGLTFVYDFGIPGWMCGAGSSVDCRQLPTNLTWLSNFATALATKYKGQIKYYETNNEVNNPRSRGRIPAPIWFSCITRYMRLLKQLTPPQLLAHRIWRHTTARLRA